MTFAFGIFGYLLKRFGFERPPLILAFVLGPLVETAFRQSLISSSGSFTIFVTRPLSAVFPADRGGRPGLGAAQEETIRREAQ